jgi:hypothetical protein
MASELSYPIGRFTVRMATTVETRRQAVEDIAALPARLRDALAGLGDAELDTPYRPGGWSVRQLVHHVADSHMNGYIRLKLALTEANPTIKPYEQEHWANLSDSRLPIAPSLGILDGVHTRWTTLWRAMGEPEFERIFSHPELGPLTTNIHAHLYGWHSRHHVAHITACGNAKATVDTRGRTGQRVAVQFWALTPIATPDIRFPSTRPVYCVSPALNVNSSPCKRPSIGTVLAPVVRVPETF